MHVACQILEAAAVAHSVHPHRQADVVGQQRHELFCGSQIGRRLGRLSLPNIDQTRLITGLFHPHPPKDLAAVGSLHGFTVRIR
eukprot:4907156-Prymnesium_polylepis.1